MNTRLALRAAVCATVLGLLNPFTPAANATVFFQRVNLTNSGQQEPYWSYVATVSSDADRIAFTTSLASDGSVHGVFVRDRSAPSTTRIDVTPTGAAGNGTSDQPMISANGEFVVFVSTSSDLVSGDTNDAQDVFIRDIAEEETWMVSKNSSGTIGNSVSMAPSVSSDGRYVAFESSASNLVSGDAAEYYTDVFVKDMDDGSLDQVNLPSSGGEPECSFGIYMIGCGGTMPQISANGEYVAFSSHGQYASSDENFVGDIFRRDLDSSITVRVSTEGASAGGAADPAISANGSVIAYVAQEVDNYSNVEAFVYDFSDTTTTHVNVPNGGGSANDHSWDMTVSPNGRLVGFTTWADNLIANDTNYSMDGFVYDRDAVNPLKRITTDGDDTEANEISSSPVFTSATENKVVFSSFASNLVANDTNDGFDVYMKGL